MLFFRKYRVRQQERGLRFKHREFKDVLRPGVYRYFDPFRTTEVLLSPLRGWVDHEDLDVIVKSGALGAEAEVLDLKDDERALVWRDGRFEAILGPGLFAGWTNFSELRIERLKASEPAFSHDKLTAILAAAGSEAQLLRVDVDADHVALVFVDGELHGELAPGQYAFWKHAGRLQVTTIDQRERVVDVAGQEIMTADKVTLRLNAVVTFRVSDAKKAVSAVDDYPQALYREAQLALRAVIGTRELDPLLADKDAVAAELLAGVKQRAAAFGIEVTGLGIRDVILPGDMRELLNKVTEAKKAAEAALITRREETAAMRSQANTAKLLENNPLLMRMRELDTIERVADKAKLTVVLGEQGLAERLVKMV